VHPHIQDRYQSLLKELYAVWGELGVEISNETPDADSYLETFRASEGLEMRIMRWMPDYDDPDNFTYTHFHTADGQLKGSGKSAS
jgi:ABC-type oligopeptide transport system substrate-binding subunit